MNKELKVKLSKATIDELDQLEFITDANEKARAVDNICKLTQVQVDAEEKRKQRWTDFGLAAGTFAITTLIQTYLVDKGFRLEETGTYTTKTLSKLIDRFWSKK